MVFVVFSSSFVLFSSSCRRLLVICLSSVRRFFVVFRRFFVVFSLYSLHLFLNVSSFYFPRLVFVFLFVVVFVFVTFCPHLVFVLASSCRVSACAHVCTRGFLVSCVFWKWDYHFAAIFAWWPELTPCLSASVLKM